MRRTKFTQCFASLYELSVSIIEVMLMWLRVSSNSVLSTTPSLNSPILSTPVVHLHMLMLALTGDAIPISKVPLPLSGIGEMLNYHVRWKFPRISRHIRENITVFVTKYGVLISLTNNFNWFILESLWCLSLKHIQQRLQSFDAECWVALPGLSDQFKYTDKPKVDHLKWNGFRDWISSTYG